MRCNTEKVRVTSTIGPLVHGNCQTAMQTSQVFQPGREQESSLGPLPYSVMGEGATGEEYLSSNTGADPEGAKAGGYHLNILLELGNKP